MASVFIHPPKTPVTKGSFGIAKATLPNMCKMPGPPAPFVPTPLPNIGKSGDSPEGYSTSVKIEGNAVAIQGASFKSMGDIASKGLGGGMLSMNTHGPTKFIGPGSLTVKIEGKAVHLKGEPMFNNCGPSGSPPNSSTLSGENQSTGTAAELEDKCEQIKQQFKIHLASHKENTRGATKMTSSSKTPGESQQSHHIFQDAALHGMVPRAAALAIMLADSFKGTEHGDITAEQNSRRYNKSRGGPTPGTTFGAIKQQARDDLVKGLEGKRKTPAPEERPMTKAEAEQAADCIVAEAEEVAKEEYEKKTGKELTDQTPVKQPGECLAGRTLVQLCSGQLRAVEQLRRGDRLLTGAGVLQIIRIDLCRSSLVVLSIGNARLELAPYHRLYDRERRPIRADMLGVGDLVMTRVGLQAVSMVSVISGPVTIYRLGLERTSTCYLGPLGVVAELPYGGPPIVCEEHALPLTSL